MGKTYVIDSPTMPRTCSQRSVTTLGLPCSRQRVTSPAQDLARRDQRATDDGWRTAEAPDTCRTPVTPFRAGRDGCPGRVS